MGKNSGSKKPRRAEYVAKVVEYLNVAFKDYLGARTLILAELLPQGAILASTAVEKYLKAILAFNGQECHGHLRAAHRRAAINFDRRFEQSLNRDFLELLQKCYLLRYLDQLPVDFNLVIAAREFLAELDDVATLIEHNLNIADGDGNGVLYGMRFAIAQRDERLLAENHILSRQPKEDFIAAEDQRVYEVRNCRVRGLMEAEYTSIRRFSDGKFLRPGWVPKGHSYQLALAPMRPNPDAVTGS